MTLKEWDERGDGLLFIAERYTILRRWIPSVEAYRYFLLAHLLTYPYLAIALAHAAQSNAQHIWIPVHGSAGQF